MDKISNAKGFVLIELLVFIIVISILASTILTPFSFVFLRTTDANNQVSVTWYAAQCLEWFLGQRSVSGYDTIACNTTVPNFCSVPSGYTINISVSCATQYDDPNNYKTITATVNGNNSASATLSLIIANY